MAKTIATTKRKSYRFSAKLQMMESCILKDQVKLSNEYPKALKELDKAVNNATLELKKAKQKIKPAKRSKAAAKTSNTKIASLDTLEKQLSHLKTEKNIVKAAHQKFIGLQKSVKTFEKEWAKNFKQKRKFKKSANAEKSKKQLTLFESASAASPITTQEA